jgi:hypothetical protein
MAAQDQTEIEDTQREILDDLFQLNDKIENIQNREKRIRAVYLLGKIIQLWQKQ